MGEQRPGGAAFSSFRFSIPIVMALAALALLSCAGLPKASDFKPPRDDQPAHESIPEKMARHSPTAPPPPTLKHVDGSLDWFIPLALLGVAVGAALFFFMPLEHRISFAIAGGSGTLLALSLLLKVSLWIMPYVAIAAIALVIVVGSIEVYVHYFKPAPPPAA